MRYTASEKLEIIGLVEGSDLGMNRTLQELLGIHKRTFYNWYQRYRLTGGFAAPVASKKVAGAAGTRSRRIRKT